MTLLSESHPPPYTSIRYRRSTAADLLPTSWPTSYMSFVVSDDELAHLPCLIDTVILFRVIIHLITMYIYSNYIISSLSPLATSRNDVGGLVEFYEIILIITQQGPCLGMAVVGHWIQPWSVNVTQARRPLKPPALLFQTVACVVIVSCGHGRFLSQHRQVPKIYDT